MTVLPLWRRSRERAAGRAAAAPAEALVFSGGGSLGAAQVGALRALLEAGVAPDLVVGCSVGALNAAFLALHPTLDGVDRLERVWLGLTRQDVFPDRWAQVARRLLRRRDHLYTAEGLARVIDDCVPVADLGDTEVPCHVVTTDLLTGRPAWWSSGPPRAVLAASACLPGLFPPVPLGGSLHVDGGVTCPVPVQHALELGARRVWVLDVVSEFSGWSGERMTALDVLLESFAASRSHIARQPPLPGPGQRVVTLPPLGIGRHDIRDFSRTAELLAAGLVAGRATVTAELAAAS